MSKLSPVTTAALHATSNNPFMGRNASVAPGFGDALATVRHGDPGTAAEQTSRKIGPDNSSYSKNPAITDAPVAQGIGNASSVRRGNVARSFGNVVSSQSVELAALPVTPEFRPSNYPSEDSVSGRSFRYRMLVDGRHDSASQGDFAFPLPMSAARSLVGLVSKPMIPPAPTGAAVTVQSSVAGGQASAVPEFVLPVALPLDADGLAIPVTSQTIGAKSIAPASANDVQPGLAADDPQRRVTSRSSSKVAAFGAHPATADAEIAPSAAGAFLSTPGMVLDPVVLIRPVSDASFPLSRVAVEHHRDTIDPTAALPTEIGTTEVERLSPAVPQSPAQNAGPEVARDRRLSSDFQSSVVPTFAGMDGLSQPGDTSAIAVSARPRIHVGTEISQSFDHPPPDLSPGIDVGPSAVSPTLPSSSLMPIRPVFADGSGLPSIPLGPAVLGLVGNFLSSSDVVTQNTHSPLASVAQSMNIPGVRQASSGFSAGSFGVFQPVGISLEQVTQTVLVRHLSSLAPVGTGIEDVASSKGLNRVVVASSTAAPIDIALDRSQAPFLMIGASDAAVGRITLDAIRIQPLARDGGVPVGVDTQSAVGHSDSSHGAQQDAVQAYAGQVGRFREFYGQDGNPQANSMQVSTEQAISGFAASIGGTSVSRSLSTGATLPPAVREQVAAAAAMAQGRDVNGRFSVSITPDELGHISITVERGTDGITTIHVAAERMATLDMLRTDQRDLMRCLDQSGLERDQHSLSFSWDGGSGGSAWAGQGWGDSRGEPSPSEPTRSYAREPIAVPITASPTRGGVDVTA